MLKYCSIGSGSSGNCHFVSYKDTNILIDAGLSGKRIMTGLDEINADIEKIKGIFITHEHSDHIKGAGILSRKLDIPIFANVKTWCAMKDKLGNIKEEHMKVFENDKTYSIGDIGIKPFSIPHDSVDAVGYNLFSSSEKMSIATDIGCITENIRQNLYGSKLVVLESNYDPEVLRCSPYPFSLKSRIAGPTGHLPNEMAGKTISYLLQSGLKSAMLGHLSKQSNFPELAYQTVLDELISNNYDENSLTLAVAKRDTNSKLIEL